MDTTTLTHRRLTDTLPGTVLLFAERNNEHYGPHVWTLTTELPEVTEEVVEFAAEWYNVDADAIRDEVDCPDLVNTAGVWEDPQFCLYLWAKFEVPGYRTQDGAVVLDQSEVELTYHCEEE